MGDSEWVFSYKLHVKEYKQKYIHSYGMIWEIIPLSCTER